MFPGGPASNVKSVTPTSLIKKNRFSGGTRREYYQIQKLEELYGSPLTGDVEVAAPPGAVKGFPANCDIRFIGNSTNSSGDPIFDPDLLDLAGTTNSPAPR